MFTYLGKFGKTGIKLFKGKGGDLLAQFDIDGTSLIRQEGDKFLVKQVKDGEIIEVAMTETELASVTKESLADVLRKTELLNAFINNWTESKILALPKGQRPLPSEYLKPEYIYKHLSIFDDGAVRFTSRNSFNLYGTLGPDGGFILPKSELDRILNETGGDMRLVEKKLGLDDGYLSDSDVMIVLIEKKDFQGLCIPSGNEGGANKFWIPGGYTSGGVPEATLIFSSKPKYSEINLY